jgi:copper homeostasis protein (lipoprotein)
MNRKHFTTLCLVALVVLAGCKRETAATPDVAPAAETQPVASPPAEMAPATQPAPEADTALDTRAFAGNFSGTLPCADCPGIDTMLELHADGTFMLMETYLERKVEPAMLDGTWTAEENGSRIRLDPNSKSEQDRLYAVDSRDQITQLGSDGTPPAATGPDFSLKRDAAKP